VRERLAVGWIKRSHGTSGQVRVQSYSGDTEHLASLRSVYVEPDFAELEVEAAQEVHGGVLFKLRGVDRPEEADLLRGRVLWADRTAASPLGRGEYYVGDLAGCEVRRGGKVIGTAASFVEGGATALLEVRGAEGAVFLVPFVEEFVGEVSVEDRVIELKESFEVP
jgi:16S rRNA processing protein RimM